MGPLYFDTPTEDYRDHSVVETVSLQSVISAASLYLLN